MKSRIEMGGGASPEEYHNYGENVEKFIVPYIIIDGTDQKIPDAKVFAQSIANILDSNDDELLNDLRSNDMISALLSSITKALRYMLKKNMISENAPWFEKLEEKIRILEIFTASTDQEMDIRKVPEKLRRLRKESPGENSNDSTKK